MRFPVEIYGSVWDTMGEAGPSKVIAFYCAARVLHGLPISQGINRAFTKSHVADLFQYFVWLSKKHPDGL